MVCVRWVSSALRTGEPGVAAGPSVWALVAPWGEWVLLHPVLQGTAAPTWTTDVTPAYDALNRSTNRVDAIGTTGYSYVQ